MQASFMNLHVFVVMNDILMNGFLQAQSGGWVGCAFLCSKKFAVPPTSLILQFSFHNPITCASGGMLVLENGLMDSNFSLNKT